MSIVGNGGADGKAIICPVSDRAAWLAARQSGIGSSEAPAVCGESKWADAATVYARKLGLIKDQPETFRMKLGRLLEPVLLNLYRDEVWPDVPITQQFVRSESAPFMLATIDAIRSDGRPVEFKTAGDWTRDEWGEEGTDLIPRPYLIQVHHQMIVAEADAVDVYVLLGMNDPPRLYTIPRNELLCRAIVDIETEFWDRVQTKRPPLPTDRADPAIHAALYGKGNGETILLDAIAAGDAAAYLEGAEGVKEFEAQKKDAKARLLAALGENTAGMLPDGRVVKRYVTEYPERTQVVEAHQAVTVRILKGKSKG